jgi:hypothetical protein
MGWSFLEIATCPVRNGMEAIKTDPISQSPCQNRPTRAALDHIELSQIFSLRGMLQGADV